MDVGGGTSLGGAADGEDTENPGGADGASRSAGVEDPYWAHLVGLCLDGRVPRCESYQKARSAYQPQSSARNATSLPDGLDLGRRGEYLLRSIGDSSPSKGWAPLACE